MKLHELLLSGVSPCSPAEAVMWFPADAEGSHTAEQVLPLALVFRTEPQHPAQGSAPFTLH